MISHSDYCFIYVPLSTNSTKTIPKGSRCATPLTTHTNARFVIVIAIFMPPVGCDPEKRSTAIAAVSHCTEVLPCRVHLRRAYFRMCYFPKHGRRSYAIFFNTVLRDTVVDGFCIFGIRFAVYFAKTKKHYYLSPKLVGCFDGRCCEPCCSYVLEKYGPTLLVVSWVSRI
jgi:hypothetical protein